MRLLWLASLTFICVSVSPVVGEDWPQWLGTKRDSVWREKGIVARFPQQGLRVEWRVPVGLGYAGPAVSDGRLYVMDYLCRSGEVTNNPGRPDRLEGAERVLCLDAGTGKPIWKHEYDRPYGFSFGGGPRCTPTVDGQLVFTLGAEGNLACLEAHTGKLVWSKDFVKDYGAKSPFWGVAAHPLVADDLLFCVVGGPGSVAVAFDKRTGREVWRALSAEQQGYCPPTMIEYGGRRQLIIWHGESINGLDPASGRVFWSVPLKPNAGMAITTPRQLGPYLLASGYGDVGVLLKLDDAKPAAEVVWRGKAGHAIYCCNSTPFLENGTIFGCDISTGALMGVRLSDGERLWQTVEPTTGGTRRGRYGTAFIVKHEDRFFLFSETGDLILAKLSPQGYTELGRFHVLEPTSLTFGRNVVWSHPAFAHKSVFARNDKELVRVNLAAE
jgi:outer membrane protein assembly factor BamB